MLSRRSRLAFGVTSLLFIILLSSCVLAPSGTTQATFPTDATFSDFYHELGGNTTLGPAISSAFTNAGLTYQYVVSGLMVYDPNQEMLRRFHFSPLATSEWHINGMVEPAPADSNTPFVNGHQIWNEVRSFYDQYGSDIIGLPLTSVMANDAKQRYEQYFEGLGFYRNYTDQPGEIHLMPYGAWMCGSNCAYQVADSTPPTNSYTRDYSETEQLFLKASERLGYGFTGAPLTKPRLGKDGNYEMVFENVVLYLDPSAGDQVSIRPLPEWLGVQKEQPVSEKDELGLSFYPLQDGLGFNVPDQFLEYISLHGSQEFAGNPIAEYRKLGDGGYSQCFTNLCLEYHPNAPQALLVRPHPLGAEYLSLGENVSASGSSVSGALQINAWEDSPLIPSGHSQRIHVEATKDGIGMSGIQASLVVKQPNGITKTYTLAPTGEDGRSYIDLDPINGPNGAVVQYEVCILGGVSPQICFSRSYTIWEQ